MITGTNAGLVRTGFSEIDIWSGHVGPSLVLRAIVVEGPLDAPERILAGAMISTTIGPVKAVIVRGMEK